MLSIIDDFLQQPFPPEQLDILTVTWIKMYAFLNCNYSLKDIVCLLLGRVCVSAQHRAVLFSRRGEKWPLCVCCIFLPTFMAAGCCVLLLPFVGAFLQCSLLHSWQIVCRGRFSAVQQPLRLHLSISSCFASVNIPLRGSCVWREIPAKHRAWSESMNHAWTCAGNTPFSLWIVISGWIPQPCKCFVLSMYWYICAGNDASIQS